MDPDLQTLSVFSAKAWESLLQRLQ